MIENIIVNDNAYFYSKTSTLSKAAIDRIFQEVSRTKSSRKGSFKESKQIVNVGSKSLYYSICIFPYEHKPSFLKEDVEGFYEVKFSFLLIVEYDEYVVISRNNVAGIRSIYRFVEPIDYDVVSRLFVSDVTLFEKFYVSNMNTSDLALRNKSIEAINLRGNISNISASKQVVNSMRIDNVGKKIALSLNTARINSLSNRHSLKDYFEWVVSVCDKISIFGYQESYLDIFAKPIDYGSHKDDLIPLCILLKFDKIKEEIELNLVEEIYLVNDDGEKDELFDFQALLKEFDCSCDIQQNDEGAFNVINDVDDEMFIKLSEKSIRLHSEYFDRIKIKKGENTEHRLTEYLNFRNEFIVNFEETELVYTHGKLFKDHRLLGNLDGFLSVFEVHQELELTISEKGMFANGQTEFSNGSIFKFIDENLAGDSSCLFCDDLGNEWADFIGVRPDSVSFYHAKHGIEGLSASALQEVIGQAQKNFGNMEATEQMLQPKRGFWANNYNSAGGENTSISRLRTSAIDIDDAMNFYRSVLSLPNISKRVYLVIDFISKQNLSNSLTMLKDGVSFERRPQVLQILWFVSSLIASGRDQGLEIYICCQP